MAIDLKYGRVTLENGTIGDDEPVFVLRAQDRLARSAIMVYALLCDTAGAPDEHIDRLETVLLQFWEWQFENPPRTPGMSLVSPASAPTREEGQP